MESFGGLRISSEALDLGEKLVVSSLNFWVKTFSLPGWYLGLFNTLILGLSSSNY